MPLLELTESVLLQPKILKPIRSLYTDVIKGTPEVSIFPCVTIETTACEKFISLLRRTAAFNRDNTQADDETLIRHVYDLHLISDALDFSLIKPLIKQVIQIDEQQFGNKHPIFRENPTKELRYGLHLLVKNPIYGERYKKFIGPLIYHPAPATWDQAIKTISKMAENWLD